MRALASRRAVITPRATVGPDDHMRGPADARVTLLEYGDYECPYCGRAYHVVADVLRPLRDVRYVFRHFPLTRVHPHALAAAEAAEAAGAQGKFWPMHAALFENQDALEPEDLVSYGRAIGLDVSRFVDELRSGMYRPRITRDFRSGVRMGVNGTPTFFINGERLDAPWDPATLSAALARAA
jgi:protein-disulfide isomerase